MIIKAKSFDNFTVVSNTVARDKTISMKAKGLFLTLASLPSDWVIYQTQLHEFSCDGSRATMKAFKELIAAGYIHAVRKVKSNGHFNGWNYIVYPEKQAPQVIQPNCSFAKLENAVSHNEQLTNKEETNKDLTNKEKHTQSFSPFFENSLTTTPKQQEKKNHKPRATDTIDVRRKKFWAEIVAASHKVSTNQESADDFFNHYTSTAIDNENLMRFEADRFWNTEKRLAKWMKLEKPNEYE